MTSDGLAWLGQPSWVSPLTFLTATGDRVHCPMVRATVAGVETRLIVDTGASTHLLTRALVSEAGLRGDLGEMGHDVAGGHVPSDDVGAVRTEIAGDTVTLSGAVAIDGPPPFAAWGIGGFVSPQQLWPAATVTVDLATKRIARFDSPSPPPRSPAGASRTPVRARFSAGCGLLLVPVTVNNGPVLVVFLDTGAATTEVDQAAVADVGGGQVIVGGAGVGGAPILVTELQSPELRVAGNLVPVGTLGLRAGFPTPEGSEPEETPIGLIGMDILGDTTVVIGPQPDRDVVWYLDM